MSKSNQSFEYFASANTYNGFKSYFDSVYDSKKFDRIIVLNGGPGTGKSTLLKRLEDFSLSHELHTEIFRCSSDIKSLDGIIIQNSTARVAALDGTAPHLRGADIPGVVDEMFDIAAFFNTSHLKSKREQIIDLNKKKANSYSIGYNNLMFSSVFKTNIMAELYNQFDFKKCFKEINNLINNLKDQKNSESHLLPNPEEKRLISSFSKDGEIHLNTPSRFGLGTVRIDGRYGEELIFIKCLSEKLRTENYKYIEFPFALDPSFSNCIICEALNLSVYTSGSAELVINANDFLKMPELSEDFNFQNREAKQFKDRAKNAFSDAAKYHFELEDIYTPAINFDSFNKATELIFEKLGNTFNI